MIFKINLLRYLFSKYHPFFKLAVTKSSNPYPISECAKQGAL